jgi:ATP phosphoribosyltransferase
MKDNDCTVRLALPKGRMNKGVIGLLTDAGIEVRASDRGYRPGISMAGFEVKILKPQNIVEMLAHGSRDVGFAGADWVAEKGVELVELLDTGLDAVSMVVAAPEDLIEDGELPKRRLVVASEYERLTAEWIQKSGIDATMVRSYGATEVFPPEDADIIVDLKSTGATLRANQLVVVGTIMTSSTRMYASRAAMQDPDRRELIEGLVLLMQSVLEARRRVMVEVNVTNENLEAVVAILPCMREPTLSPLRGGAGYAVKAAVPREDLPRVIPEIKRRGGTDVVVMQLTQIVP